MELLIGVDALCDKYVKLNVGGSLFQTTLSTLKKQDTMLRTMFNGEIPVATDSDGFVLIDRSGQHFGTILNFLRDGTVPLPYCRLELEQILAEARFYCVKDLEAQCMELLSTRPLQLEGNMESSQLIRLFFDPTDTQALLARPPTPALIGAIVFTTRGEPQIEFKTLEYLYKNVFFFRNLTKKYCDRILFIQEMLEPNSPSQPPCSELVFYVKQKDEFTQLSVIELGERCGDTKYCLKEFPELRITQQVLGIFSFKGDNLCRRCRVNLCTEKKAEEAQAENKAEETQERC
ncbi:K+ channel tetramerization domain protein [Ancylostoma caninum]|uniref:K+ channel tetramerization domain protein n=1 Tax=Ancylostoma caninum TaxID=29170 RepID=A0A368H7M3_ANCCA|nr:K+ channel tetramerization domain protein [Ancylostoma caninum]